MQCQVHDFSVGFRSRLALVSSKERPGQGRPWLPEEPLCSLSWLPWEPCATAAGVGGTLQGPEQLWQGPIFASLFLGALGSSCRKRMLAICWCSKLAPHPGRAAQCQSLVKTLARAAFLMPGVSSSRVGMWPSAQPEAAQGRGGVLSRPQPCSPACLEDHTPPPALVRGTVVVRRSRSILWKEEQSGAGRTVSCALAVAQ